MSGTITFPPNPTDGQLYTSGGVTWQWHANPGVWVNANTGTNFLALSGGTMTGAITLPGNAASALQAVPLQQVVPIAGGTMTGALTLSGNAATALQATPLQQVNAVVAPAFNDVGRNVIHNGLFNVAQRGAGAFGTSGAYTLDRWVLAFNSDTGVGVQQIALLDSARTQIGDEAAAYCLQLATTGNAAASAFTQIYQPIEGVRRLAGKTITVSFWATSGTGLKLGINGYSNYGTGGSPSAAASWASPGSSVTLTTTWARYSLTFTVPTASGKTLGTNNNDSNILQIFLSSGATNNAAAGNIGVQSGVVQIWGVQLEVGSVMTALDYGGSPQQQLAQCQRFYRFGVLFGQGYGGVASAAAAVVDSYPVPMRATPTVVASSVSNTNISGAAVGASGSLGMVYANGSTAAAGNWTFSINYTASADL